MNSPFKTPWHFDNFKEDKEGEYVKIFHYIQLIALPLKITDLIKLTIHLKMGCTTTLYCLLGLTMTPK